jgi:hypothetical protein
MPIELAGIQLNRIHKIQTLEQGKLVYHQIPGMQGNMVQNLGRESVRLQVRGIFYGANAKKDLEALRKIYKQREPVDFLADVVGQAYFSQVILERFEVVQSAQEPDQFSYILVIAEYIPPSETKTISGASRVDAAIQSDAANFITVATLPDALQIGALPEITNPIEPLKGAINPLKEATNNFDEVTKGLKVLFNL